MRKTFKLKNIKNYRNLAYEVKNTGMLTMKDKNEQVVFIDSTNIADLEMVEDYKMFEKKIR